MEVLHMKKVKINCITMDTIVEKYRINKEYVLKDEDIFAIISDMRELVQMNVELGYLDEIKEDILNIKDISMQSKNTIVKKDTIKDVELQDLTIEFIKSLDEQGLLLVIEPNNNLFVDIDYVKLTQKIKKYSSMGFVGIITALISIQEEAIVDENGNLNKSAYRNLYDNILVSTDFEKNPVRFKYMNIILDDLVNIAGMYHNK